MTKITCKKCNGTMHKGIAIPTRIDYSDEGTGSFGAWREEAPLMHVVKCEDCGHSLRVESEFKPYPAPDDLDKIPVLERKAE